MPQRDLNPSRLPVPPRPRGLRRIEARNGIAVTESGEDRERESRESPETKYDEAVEKEAEERARLAERVGDPSPPKEENEGD